MTDIKNFSRFEFYNNVSYGQILDNKIQAISDSPLASYQLVSQPIDLSKVKRLISTEPQKKIFAVGMNFASHVSSASSNAPPPLFLKLPTSLIASGKDIVLPADAKNVNY